MLIHESIFLATCLDKLCPESVLDIGSGPRPAREITQPHIHAAFRGHRTFLTDMNPSPGMLYCDITDASTLSLLPRCEMVTCCSMLEHVTDIDSAIDNLCSLADKWLIVAVPFSYPEHHCPIDNMWRPAPCELGEKLESRGFIVVESMLTPPENFNGVTDASASMVLAIRA